MKHKKNTNNAYKTNPKKINEEKFNFLPVEKWWPPRPPDGISLIKYSFHVQFK
jgi:hypothetical protein